MLRFVPPVVTGTLIAVIGISLMRVGVGWGRGGPPNLAQSVDVPKLVAMVDGAKGAAGTPAPVCFLKIGAASLNLLRALCLCDITLQSCVAGSVRHSLIDLPLKEGSQMKRLLTLV